jgi:hypothetical protein
MLTHENNFVCSTLNECITDINHVTHKICLYTDTEEQPDSTSTNNGSKYIVIINKVLLMEPLDDQTSFEPLNTTICIDLAFEKPHAWYGTTICGLHKLPRYAFPANCEALPPWLLANKAPRKYCMLHGWFWVPGGTLDQKTYSVETRSNCTFFDDVDSKPEVKMA